MVIQRNVYIIDEYCVIMNKVTNKEEIVDLHQALATNMFTPTVPSIADNIGGMHMLAFGCCCLLICICTCIAVVALPFGLYSTWQLVDT